MNPNRLLMPIFALAATAAGAVEPDQALITLELKAGGRQISFVSHEFEWRFRALDDDRAQVRVRIPVDSFDSGHDEFDSALRRAAGSDRHPFAQLDGIVQEGRLDGVLDLAGVVRPVAVRLHTERVGGNVIAVASLAIDLRDYGIAFEGVDPHVTIDAIVRLAVSPNAVLAGGFNQPTN